MNYLQEPVQRPNGVSMTQWFLCTKGTGELLIDGQKSLIHEGDGFLIAAHKPHGYHGIEGDFVLNSLGFDGKLVPKMMSILGMTESGVYHFSNPDEFLKQIKKIEKLSHKKQPDEKLLYSSEIYNTLLMLSNNITRVTNSSNLSINHIVETIINYLENNYEKDISLEELSAETGRNPEYLCVLFKKETGQTIVNFLMGIRIAKSRLLLGTYPEKSVAEIGTMCGFQSPSYFGKVFRRYMKMSPGEYRRLNL